ncbi:fibronectin type III domain-containing protein [Pseudolysinimonas sp.]|jgi:hypothetical protein|uniref:fibronectin type III domain-containing protein n=1 Tax=Pseudolysinimonas sp. TaxID=2680009 RepID=UPI0037852F10
MTLGLPSSSPRSRHGSLAVVLALALALVLPVVPAHATDPDPLAARLLAEPYTSTGVRVSVSNMASMAGLATDGTTVYLLNGSSGDVITTPLSAIPLTPGGSVAATGTVHDVAWGGANPSLPGDIMRLSLSYSHGCLFITSDDNTEGSIRLYCIDVSDWSVTEIPVPAAHPLPEGRYYTYSSLIDFPDGRIGKVSRYTGTSGAWISILRTYAVTGSGKGVAITWSQDYEMADSASDEWARDEHGIATDGTYLYRIQWRDFTPNFKTWALDASAVGQVVASGQYTMPFDNMHYLAHNHVENSYLVGHYAGSSFFITAAADPGPGPGNPLEPSFASPVASTSGCTVQVTNFDAGFTWAGSATDGAAVAVDSTGLVTVSGLSRGSDATVTVRATRSGYPDGTTTFVCAALPLAVPSAPLAVTVKEEDAQLSIGWTSPSDDGGSPVTGYLVRVSDSGGTPIPGATCSATSVTYCTVAGLTPGIDYRIEVRASNSIGDGPWSAASTASPGIPVGIVLPTGPESADLTLDDATPTVGGTIRLVAEGFRPGTQVDFWIHSTPQLLGSVVADGSGIARLTVGLPAGLVGGHTVQAVGIAPSGAAWNLARGLTISSPSVAGLAGTGVDTAPGVTRGLLLVVLGLVVLVVVSRSPRSSRL